jgi:hypothetical protein
VVGLDAALADRRELGRVLAERVLGDAPVQDPGADIGVVGGDLPPALAAVVRAQAHEAQYLPAREGLDLDDLEARGPARGLEMPGEPVFALHGSPIPRWISATRQVPKRIRVCHSGSADESLGGPAGARTRVGRRRS